MLRETRDYLQKKPEDFRQRKPKRKQLFKRVGNEPLIFFLNLFFFQIKPKWELKSGQVFIDICS